ncbi:MAG: class I SAM-dependent methyltransferase [Nitrospirae bacterium]|nr:MAG: class I SAM-dependent methyltransferase [Nitrospirota bacterium]
MLRITGEHPDLITIMDNNRDRQKQFWEEAGRIGYDTAMFKNKTVEKHIMAKHRQAALDTAAALGLRKDWHVLELGCGDGRFAGGILAQFVEHIDAFDVSANAIERAQADVRTGNVVYAVKDITLHDYLPHERWDAAFLMGFLHHVKNAAPEIIARLALVCPRVIVVEPNGNNLLRKGLELLPSYRRAGEDSFRLEELLRLFSAHGYDAQVTRRITLLPPFLPEILFRPAARLEHLFEHNTFLSNACSTLVMGFSHRSLLTEQHRA